MSDQHQADESQTNTEEKSAEETLYNSEPEKKVEESSNESTEPKTEESSTEEPKVEGKVEDKAEEAQTEFELKMPEETLLSDEAKDEIVSIAKEQGFSKEQAQKILDLQSEIASEVSDQINQEFNDQVTAWGEEIKADKEVGGENLTKSVELAKRAVIAFAGEDFLAELDQTGYANHPRLFKMLTKIGQELEAKELVLSNTQSNQPKSPAEIMYPEQTQTN